MQDIAAMRYLPERWVIFQFPQAVSKPPTAGVIGDSKIWKLWSALRQNKTNV